MAWDGWKNVEETSAGKTQEKIPESKFFKNGLITNLLNPKAAVFYIAILPTFISQPVYILGQTLTFTLVYVLIATVIHCLIVTMAGSVNYIFKKERDILTVRRILSALLAAVAIWFGISTGK